MLTHLTIRNFAIAPELEIEFSTGFTVITGETGAGKSILVDALGLLLGERSDANWVRDGAERAELSADFDIGGNAPARRWLDGADLADGNSCLLRRTIGANGRSRAWINGTPVTVQQLAELGARLVEIHGQNEHLQLTQPGVQLRLLDNGGAYDETVTAVRAAFERWREQDGAYTELMNSSALSAAELDLLRYQWRELQDEAVAPEALRELEAEHRSLSHGGELLECIGSGLEQLDGEDSALADELSRVGERLTRFEGYDAEIAGARRMLEEAAINAREAASALRAAQRRIRLDPQRLEDVRRQLDCLGDLARKHRIPLERLCERRDELASRLDRADHFEEQRESLEHALNAALADYREASGRLHQCRCDRAQQLSKHVSELMGELGMAGGVFRIDIEHQPEAPPSARGSDSIRLLVSANPGVAPAPLAKVASGGELSRISLAIKVAGTGGEQRTQVFDEVDAGIGGATANAVGQLLQRLANGSQALCVTHLAQVAACAQQQIRVDKVISEAEVRVDTAVLSGEERVREIARMLSGKRSEQSLEHARELLASVLA